MSGKNDLRLDDIHIPGVDDGETSLLDDVKYHGPPGCGKTTTDAAHVARIIRDTEYTINDVVWMTYRRALADETLVRLADWGVIDQVQLENPRQGATRYIATNHAVGNRAVGGVGDIVESGHKRGFCDEYNVEWRAAEEHEKGAGKHLHSAFGWLMDNMVDPSDEESVDRMAGMCPHIEGFRERTSRHSIPGLWRKWERYKSEHEVVGFHQQLSQPVDRGIQAPRPILVIDEYHDAFPLLARLCDYWMEQAETVIVSGDPDQVVNSYQGASPSFFRELDIQKQLLDTSYRCPTEHWGLSTSLLNRAPGHSRPDVETINSGEILTHTTPGRFEHNPRQSGDVGRWSTPENDVGHPAYIALKHGDGTDEPSAPGFGVDPDDVMFLARTRKQVKGLTAALDGAGVMYTSQSGISGWEDTSSGAPKRRLLYDALDGIRGFSLEAADIDRAGQGTLGSFSSGAVDGKSTFELAPDTAAELLNQTRNKYHRFGRTTDDTGTTIDGVVGNWNDRGDDDLVTEQEFSQYVEMEFFEVYGGGPAAVEELLTGGLSDRDRTAIRQALARHAGQAPVDPGDIGISVMTIHASKGNEATDVVVYPGITTTIREGIETREQTRANEYRTWYVACTRSKERLHLTDGGFGWMSPLPNSPFPDSMAGSTMGVADD